MVLGDQDTHAQVFVNHFFELLILDHRLDDVVHDLLMLGYLVLVQLDLVIFEDDGEVEGEFEEFTH